MKRKSAYLFIFSLIFAISSCSYMVQDFKNASEAYFTLVKNYEGTDTEEIDLNLTETLFIKGNPEKFNCEEKGYYIESRVYDKESNTLTFFHKRNRVNLTFNLNGGVYNTQTGDENSIIKSGKYGAKLYQLDPNGLIKTDFAFVGWSKEPDGPTVDIPYEYPAEDCTYYAIWKTNDEHGKAKYTIQTRLQNIDNDEYTVLYENIHYGDVGTETTVTAVEREGFNPQQIVQQTIAADGSTVVYVNYNRKDIYYTFILSHNEEELLNCYWPSNPGNNREIIISGKYEAPVTDSPEDPEHNEIDGEVWEFAGWNEVNGRPDDIFRKDRIYYAIWKKTISKYTVEHYFEAIDENAPYEKNESSYPDVEEKNTTGELTNAQPYKNTPGFTLDRIENVILEETGTVAKVYYRRATILVTLDPNGGKWGDGTTEFKLISGQFGRPFPAVVIEDDLSKLQGWLENGVTKCDDLPQTFPAYNTTYLADWNKIKSIYTVKYYYENIDDNEYTQNKLMTETHVGNIGEYTTVAQSINEMIEDGFNFETEPADVLIPETDDTVIEVRFKRNRVTVTADVNGATWEDGTKEPKDFNGKYGAPLIVPSSDWPLHSANHREVSFDNGHTWTVTERPVVFPAHNAIYRIIWDDLGVKYQVKYYEQNVSGSGYTLVDTQDKTGASGDTTTIIPETKPGFNYQPVVQQVINSKGTTVVEVKYDRKTITLLFGSGDHGHWSDDVPAKTVTGLYGQAVTVPNAADLVVDELYEFDGWSLESSDAKITIPSTFPEEDVDYKARWAKIESTEVTDKDGSWVVDPGATDITISRNVNGGKNWFSVTVPFEGNWTFIWVIDGATYTQDDVSIALGKGKHQVSVEGRCEGIAIPYTADLAFEIQ